MNYKTCADINKEIQHEKTLEIKLAQLDRFNENKSQTKNQSKETLQPFVEIELLKETVEEVKGVSAEFKQ
jgi:hypothetical protein